MKIFSVLFLLAISSSAYADYFNVLVGYTCDKKNDKLVITYDGAYNEDGDAMIKNKSETQWEPWALVVFKDDDHIESLTTIHRQCRLSDGYYDIRIIPSPGNFNIQGRCGAWMTASAIVKKGKKIVHEVQRFESDCHDMDSPITTRVTIKPGETAAEVLTVDWKDFYK